jgi:hypothetical protein
MLSDTLKRYMGSPWSCHFGSFMLKILRRMAGLTYKYRRQIKKRMSYVHEEHGPFKTR